MGLGTLFYKWIDRPYYKDVSLGLLILNWIIQRIFGINTKVPFSVHFTSKIKGYENMILHPDIRLSIAISGNLYLMAFNKCKIEIQEKTIIAPNVVINNGNHGLLDRNIHSVKDIFIGKNCWIGTNCVILGGAKLGKNVTVAAGSVVNKEFPDNVVIAGTPAKIIKTVT